MFWRIVYRLVAMHMPMSGSKIGKFRYGEIGRKLRAYTFCKMSKNENGENINIEKNVSLTSQVCIGDNSGIGAYSILNGKVTIGKNVMIGRELQCYTVNHNIARTDIPMIEQGFSTMKPIIIEDDVWIGARVTILGGVTVGKGAVIGAGSVVTHDVLPYTVNAGNPARKVKER